MSVINPGQVALFARSLPRRGKTDALDAQLLVRFAAERQPAPWIPPEQVYHELRQRLVVRDGLLHMRTHAKNQRHAIQQWPVRIAPALEALDTVIAQLDAQVVSLEREIAEVLRNGAWASSARVLLTAPGIGLMTTGWLLVGTLNFTIAQSPDQLSAYVAWHHWSDNPAQAYAAGRRSVTVETSGYGQHCTWRPWRQPATIQAFGHSINACVRQESRRRWPDAPLPGSYCISLGRW